MKTIGLRALFTIAIIFTLSPNLYASDKANHAITLCKADAKERFSEENGYKRRKVKKIRDKSAYTDISFYIYPQAQERFVAVCRVNKKGGEIVSFTPRDQS